MDRIVLVECQNCELVLEMVKHGEDVEIVKDECPECGGIEFKNTDTGEVIQIDE